MELMQLSSSAFYIPNSTNIGVILDGRAAILIDSGIDGSVAKNVVKLLGGKDYYIKAIVNTHSHADHCGGNDYIKNASGALTYASEIEAGIIEYPYWEPVYLYSGASPISDLRNKFLMANSSKVDYVIGSKENSLLFDKIELGIVRLPGHSLNQIGVVVDDVLFCADSVYSKEVLNKHKIPFCVDVEKQKETLDFLRNSVYKLYVPSHSKPVHSIEGLVDTYLGIIHSVEGLFWEILKEKKTTQEILKQLCDYYRIKTKTIPQYYLMNTVTLAYISFLYNNDKLSVDISSNLLYWQRK